MSGRYSVTERAGASMTDLELDEVGRLRAEAYAARGHRIPDAPDGAPWLDAFERVAWHVLARLDGRLVAAGRVSIHERVDAVPDPHYAAPHAERVALPCACLTRLVIALAHAGHGLTGELDRRRLAIARRLGARSAIATAAPLRVPRLVAAGFVVAGTGAGRVPGIVVSTLIAAL